MGKKISFQNEENYEISPRFLGRTHFDTTNLRTWYCSARKTYINFLAQETGVIRKLFILKFFFSQKMSKSAIEISLQ